MHKSDIEILDIIYVLVLYVYGHFVQYILCFSETSARKAPVKLHSMKKDLENWLNKTSWNTVFFFPYTELVTLNAKTK